MRTLDDGHLSRLDLEKRRSNLVAQAATQNRRITQALRCPEETPVTFPQLWPSNAYEDDIGTAAEMRCMDLLQLVSGQDLKMRMGLPAVYVEAEEDLYFSAGAIDDDSIAGDVRAPLSSGFRSGNIRNATLTARLLGFEHEAGDLNDSCYASATYLGGTPAEDVMYQSNGDAWVALTTLPAQSVTITRRGVLAGFKLYLKRDAGTDAGTIGIAVQRDDGTGLPGGLVCSSLDVDVLTLSTSGAWVAFTCIASEGYPIPTVEVGDVLHISMNYAGGPNSYWYQDATAAGYAGGHASHYSSGWIADPTKDHYISVLTYVETTVDLIADYDGVSAWREITISLPSLMLNHNFYNGENYADFLITLGPWVSLNAVGVFDTGSNAELHWRAGHVRTPFIRPPLTAPYVEVYNSASLTTTSGTGLTLTFDSEVEDAHGFHSLTTNTGRLTVPTGLDGLYLATAHIRFAATGSGTYRILQLFKNDEKILAMDERSPYSSRPASLNVATPVRLAAGDYLTLLAQQDSGGSLAVSYSTSSGVGYVPYFRLVRIGS